MNIALWIGVFLFIIPGSIMLLPYALGSNCSTGGTMGRVCGWSFGMLVVFGMTGIWIIGLISLIIGIIIHIFFPGKSASSEVLNQSQNGGRRR